MMEWNSLVTGQFLLVWKNDNYKNFTVYSLTLKTIFSKIKKKIYKDAGSIFMCKLVKKQSQLCLLDMQYCFIYESSL